MDEFSLPRDVSAGRRARRIIASLADASHLARPEIAELLVNEVVNNAVQHGTGAIVLRMSRLETGLRISVSDQGLMRPKVRNVALLEERGRGMNLLDALSDSWGVTDATGGGKTVWFQLDLAGTGDEPGDEKGTD
jgi:anti-sigma regulatory factor (Ser/Thr protein kinase)